MNRLAIRWLLPVMAVALLAILPASAQLVGAGGGGAGGDVAKFVKELRQLPAMHLASPTRAGVLSATSAGKRIVAVGDHGTVLLSDDDGKTWRQAREVPTRLMLTSVCFTDDMRGWAVGHWGVVLHTEDGGDSWKLLRQDTSVDQPLFSVYFMDRKQGLVVGLWSLALRTSDGGLHWTSVNMPAPPGGDKAGPNLYRIFRAKEAGTLFIAAEMGLVYRSDDGGQSWQMIQTGQRGSLWTGLALRDGSLLVAGLNGQMLRSSDGSAWTALASGVEGSIT
ncbi:MAG TPA: YCF48-related protein, partial [Steroidobacteraceae bacterium]|nr:YCF48-related protein [Steroidobacteraceae bacterium]